MLVLLGVPLTLIIAHAACLGAGLKRRLFDPYWYASPGADYSGMNTSSGSFTMPSPLPHVALHAIVGTNVTVARSS
jgi:hypothetical protein